MSVEKRNGKYLVRWRDAAGHQRSKTVRLQRDAVALDGEMKRKRAMGELIAHERGKETLQDFWAIWWERYALTYLTPRSQDNYERLWRKHIRPALGRSRMKDISHEDVVRLVAGLKLAPSTVRKIVAVLQGVLQRAVEWNYLAANPAVGVRKPRLVKQRESRALTVEEVAALRRELDPRSSTIVAVLAGTGMRPGELRGLRWSDIRADARAIVIERAVSRDTIGPTKTNGRRTVTPLESVYQPLTRWRLAAARDALVFPGHDGRVWTDQGWKMWQRNVFAPAASRAGFAGLVPYDLRHTWVSQMIAAGHDILQIASQAGHSPMMTLTTYGHLFGPGGRDHDAPARHQAAL